MATSTKARMSEQILLRLNGGRIGVATKFHPNEIKIAIEQVANQVLKVEYHSLSLPTGNVIPHGAVATYENVLVTQYKNISKITLPAMPQNLPLNMGIFSISDAADFYGQFIPVEMGIISQARSQDFLISALSGKILFEPSGLDVYFSQDLTIPNTNVYVTTKLVVLDMGKYDDYSILPIPSDMEAQIIEIVIKMFSTEPIADKLVDPGVSEEREPVNTQMQAS